MITQGSRALGIFSNVSLLKLADSVVDAVSTTGLAPVTGATRPAEDRASGPDAGRGGSGGGMGWAPGAGIDRRARRPLEYIPKGQPDEVNVHDFPQLGQGKAIPYGAYDIALNRAVVNVGVTHETAEFAVESIRRWWRLDGKRHYRGVGRLLICADGGGSNGNRPRAWKLHLQALSDETGMAITVCHYPPGTSKWNKIEHRLFSFIFISLNWKGKPLESTLDDLRRNPIVLPPYIPRHGWVRRLSDRIFGSDEAPAAG